MIFREVRPMRSVSVPTSCGEVASLLCSRIQVWRRLARSAIRCRLCVKISLKTMIETRSRRRYVDMPNRLTARIRRFHWLMRVKLQKKFPCISDRVCKPFVGRNPDQKRCAGGAPTFLCGSVSATVYGRPAPSGALER
jgi:hypothetical protein